MMSRPDLGRESYGKSKSASFHGRLPANSDRPEQIQRPESHPELLRKRGAIAGNPISPENGSRRLTKLLLNVTIQRSLGPVHVLMSPENMVSDLIKASVEIYVKDGRRPLLEDTNPQGFELHYSQFSLESLNPKEKLINLGSRNFFLCPNSCSNEATKSTKTSSPCLRFMGFLVQFLSQ
ncbi:uncharacterized protein At4g22758-like [Tasmannia lanceolata]|uniref:uncharacterized protein At4g22758-like n=1 Tax=Tasmannia lanceolata TaxID=3420 RepID=UPI0040640F8A